MIELKIINKIDPLKRNIEKDVEKEEFSPMDPPEPYAPPNAEKVDINDMHPFIKNLIEEHKQCIKELETFEEVLLSIQQKGISKGDNKKMSDFFYFFDESIIKHNKREEAMFFPLLHNRLIEHGEHSTGHDIVTAIDMMESDHVEILQLSAVVFNFFGLAMRLPDERSRLMVFDMAIEQGKALVEQLKLHIFREENIVFPLGHKLISVEEFDSFEQKN